MTTLHQDIITLLLASMHYIALGNQSNQMAPGNIQQCRVGSSVASCAKFLLDSLEELALITNRP